MINVDSAGTTAYERWRELALGVLAKSGLPQEALTTTTYDGIPVAPLYWEAGPRALTPPGRAGEWDVRQRHAEADPAAACEAVLADLENGATSLWLVTSGSAGITPADLPRVLDGVLLDLAPVVLEGPGAEVLLGLLPGETPGGTLGLDPGDPLVLRAAREFRGLRSVVIDALPAHDAGGGEGEELGCSIAEGVAALRALTAAGLSTQEAYGQLEFRYAADTDQFLTVAKLRAARRLWARVGELVGAEGPQSQHAVTSSAMMTARDPWVNILRTTIACFAAGVAGADAVTVQPFDAVLGAPSALARRIARNTQTIVMAEAHAARVADPAAGSWYVEELTAELADRAWAWFQEIERAGGHATAAEKLIPERLAETRAARLADLAHRRRPITGVSEFPNLEEVPPTPGGPGPGLASLGFRRAQPYEELRDLADAAVARTGVRPAVFLAALGSPARHTARVGFATGLFQAGGFATPTAAGDPAELAAAFAASGARTACLCGDERDYAGTAEQVAVALRAAGATAVMLAGRADVPGVDRTIFTGCDALGVLQELHGNGATP
ncbi:methylmalonyl-CoA mutase family protein [Streptosporangium saharense]